MKAHFAYLKYVLRHKWFVLLAGLDLGVPLLMLIFHDWDKFLPDEWFPYVRYFYNPDGTKADRRDKNGYYDAARALDEHFNFAWLLHQKRNKHHWQWWILPLDDGGFKTLPMPNVYRREMLADWRGAGRALGFPKTWEWYEKNKDKMQLDEATRIWIEIEIGFLKAKYEAKHFAVENLPFVYIPRKGFWKVMDEFKKAISL